MCSSDLQRQAEGDQATTKRRAVSSRHFQRHEIHNSLTVCCTRPTRSVAVPRSHQRLRRETIRRWYWRYFGTGGRDDRHSRARGGRELLLATATNQPGTRVPSGLRACEEGSRWRMAGVAPRSSAGGFLANCPKASMRALGWKKPNHPKDILHRNRRPVTETHTIQPGQSPQIDNNLARRLRAPDQNVAASGLFKWRSIPKACVSSSAARASWIPLPRPAA